jgi:anti-sigma factor RsiW
MTEVRCHDVRDAAAEYALDILDADERSAIAAHLIRCRACRAEVDAMSGVSSRLLEMVPGTEPPLGFDERVLARVRRDRKVGRRWVSRRPRLTAGLAAAVAAGVLVFGSLGWFEQGSSSHPARAALAADFIQGGRNVGEVYATERPNWVSMSVHGAKGAKKVTCQLVGRDGSITTLGSFDLVDGSGSWGAPDPTGFAGAAGARLLDNAGKVIATATFR